MRTRETLQNPTQAKLKLRPKVTIGVMNKSLNNLQII